MTFHLDEGQLAETGAALCVSDGDLAVVFDPPASAQDVVDARGDFVPFIVISEPARTHDGSERVGRHEPQLVFAKVVSTRFGFNQQHVFSIQVENFARLKIELRPTPSPPEAFFYTA